MEFIEVRDEYGNLTGEIKARHLVHRDGDIHASAHIFVIRRTENGVDILLQKRSNNKESFPGCYDISSAGHVSMGEEPLETALRELEEEIGIKATVSDLKELGKTEIYSKEIFYSSLFCNHELATVYLYENEVNIDELVLGEEEVSEVKWMSLDDCIAKTINKEPGYCLVGEELLLLKKAL